MSRTIVRTGAAAIAAVLLPLTAVPAAYADPAPDPTANWQDPTALTREATAIAERAAAKRQGSRAKSAVPATAELDAAVDALVADGATGVTARVETPELEWSGAGGVREAGKAKAAKDGDRFHIASNTKTLIATLVMQEVERGTWALDTPADDVLPGTFPAGVTIEHLLSHRSGAPRGPEELLLTRIDDPSSWEQFIDAVGQHYSEAEHLAAMRSAGWLFEPGTGFSYSNYGYVALGVMLEKETGQELDDLLRRRIFKPAGAHRSDYPETSHNRGPFLEGAVMTDPTGWQALTDLDPSVFHASGAGTGTTRDLASLNEALLTGELVSPASVEAMLPPLAGSADPAYGLGIYRVDDPCVAGEYLYGHDGAHFGTQSINWSSRDGSRQITLAWTGRDYTGATEPPYDLGLLLEPMLLATC
ncbi:serine hydrolase domain-containing protein [Nocardioides albus]|uniref:D-alanyl-D-alanine carboxypeptidase n=1 Tax=Nocardioides albus TaxID=1841 RepID=A0A7W5A158_9ACTN|nr:serine hydrolase domain-containing protein [Nocardioides albus]MBB3087737.1 D-alanyl-D-alanine carboxypeptidase [Nocardioides albus]GGU11087.1 D-Ala-D-Ala carboxypeptidase [Nocardioides albus]